MWLCIGRASSGAGLGKGTSQFQRAMPGHRSAERLQGIPLPKLPAWELLTDGLHVGEIKARISAATWVPQRAPPCQPLAQVTQTRPGKAGKTNFPSDSVAKCSFTAWHGRRVLARWWGGPQGCRQPWDKCCPSLLPALHWNLTLFLHCSNMDWEHSTIFWLHRPHIHLKRKLWMWFSTRRWKVQRMWQWVWICRSLGIQVFGGVDSKIFICIVSCSVKQITSNSRVCEAGDWWSCLMLFSS